MSKRKLSRQQAWRIEKIQEERAKRADKRGAEAEQSLASGELGPEQHGLVTAHFGTQVEVESAPGQRVRCHLRANLEKQGRTLSLADMEIAAIAMANDFTLITGNTKHFARINGLKLENWLEPEK